MVALARPGGDADSNRPTLYRYRFANAEFDEAQGTLSVAGQAVGIEPRPLRLLAELLLHVNEVVTKEELFQEVWEGRPTVDKVLANAVAKLRKALGDEAGARLLNLPRVGYRLLGPVERIVVGSMPPRALGFAAASASFDFVSCKAGQEYFRIWNDGSVDGCALPGAVQGLGNIKDRNFVPRSEPFLCAEMRDCDCCHVATAKKMSFHRR